MVNLWICSVNTIVTCLLCVLLAGIVLWLLGHMGSLSPWRRTSTVVSLVEPLDVPQPLNDGCVITTSDTLRLWRGCMSEDLSMRMQDSNCMSYRTHRTPGRRQVGHTLQMLHKERLLRVLGAPISLRCPCIKAWGTRGAEVEGPGYCHSQGFTPLPAVTVEDEADGALVVICPSW